MSPEDGWLSFFSAPPSADDNGGDAGNRTTCLEYVIPAQALYRRPRGHRLATTYFCKLGNQSLGQAMAVTRQNWAVFPCDDHGNLACPICGAALFPNKPKFVYLTRGWSSAFHLTKECSGLVGGQAFVAKRGGEPAPIEHVTFIEATKTHEPCQICFPPT